MTTTVLLLGATGRTGREVLTQLLERGVNVRAVVRSADRLPEAARGQAALAVEVADLLSLPEGRLQDLVKGCDAVISCLGHNLTLRGIYGAPRDLVARSMAEVCRAIEALRTERPVKYVLMSSVSVNQPAGRDARRGRLERSAVALLRAVLPPARDNQRAADLMARLAAGPGGAAEGTVAGAVEGVAVRPDTLLDGPVTDYRVHQALVSSLARPDSTNRANVAHFMCELVTDPQVWQTWAGRLPVIVNAATPAGVRTAEA